MRMDNSYTEDHREGTEVHRERRVGLVLTQRVTEKTQRFTENGEEYELSLCFPVKDSA
jgi:hypothetical protein